jgi:hypothetical protein
MTSIALLILFLLFLPETIETETETETGTEIFCLGVLLALPPGMSAIQGIMTTATVTGRGIETEIEIGIEIVIEETRILLLFHLLFPLQVGTGTTHAIATATTERPLRLSQLQLQLPRLLHLTCPLIRDITSRAMLLRVLVDMTLMRPLITVIAAAL